MTQENEYLIEENKVKDELKPWQRLDYVIKQWAVLSGFEKDQQFYENLRNENGKY